MIDQGPEITERRLALAQTMLRHAPESGTFSSAIAPMHIIRSDAPTDTLHVLHKPALCIIAQGRKVVRLGDERYVYDPLNYLMVSVTLPLSGQVIQASAEHPYLCLRLDIDPSAIAQLITETNPGAAPGQTGGRGLYLDAIDSPLLDATLRLLRLLDTPADIPVLAPLALREIYYRLLKGQQGQRLQEIAIADTQTYRVTKAIEWLNRHYDQPLQIEALAGHVNLSTSTLHHRFKSLTSMSPLQYQKQLRLQEARRLMIAEDLEASAAGFKVGYESPSQFSREYSRLFGAPPSRDKARIRSFA